MKTEHFENALQSWTLRKRRFQKNEVFKNAEHPPQYQFQSTPRNIRNLFKMADGRFPFLSFIPGLISTLIACFQANLALLILQSWLFQ